MHGGKWVACQISEVQETFSLTCFIRSKSKASIATSLLLLTGFILEKWKRRTKKQVSSLQCTLSYTHLMVWMKSTPEQEHPCLSTGPEAPSCAAQEHLAAGEQHCSRLHSLTLKGAAFSSCRRIEGSTKTALKLNLLFFFFFGVENLSDFRLENAEMSSGDKACLTMYFITAFAICKLDVWFSLTVFSAQQPCLGHLDFNRMLK